MPTLKQPLRFRTALVLSSALGLTLSACRLDDANLLGSNFALPGAAAAPFDFVPAPGAWDLPYAEPAPVWPAGYDDGYGWAERAYALDHAFYEAPPDYAFYYDDVQPWVWQTEDDWLMFAEPISNDDYRFYYYEPDAYYPYFVRDDRYGYAYDDQGRLVSVYDVMGRILPTAFLSEQDDIAGRYWTRAHSLRDTWREAPRLRVAEPLWETRQPVLIRAQTPWIEAASGYDDWQAYRARTGEKELRRFEQERRKREKDIVRLARAERADRAVFRNDRPPVQAASLARERAGQDRTEPRERRQAERIRAEERQRDERVQAEHRQKADRAQAEQRQKNDRAQAERRQEQRAQAERRQKTERAQAERRQKADRQRAEGEARRRQQQRAQAEQRQKAEQHQKAERQKAERQKADRQKAQRAEAKPQKQVRAERGGGGKAERGNGGGKDRKG